MSRLGNVRDMFASAHSGLDHIGNFVISALLLPVVRLIEGAPLTFGQYALIYAWAVLVVYMTDYRLGMWNWAWKQIDRRRRW